MGEFLRGLQVLKSDIPEVPVLIGEDTGETFAAREWWDYHTWNLSSGDNQFPVSEQTVTSYPKAYKYALTVDQIYRDGVGVRYFTLADIPIWYNNPEDPTERLRYHLLMYVRANVSAYGDGVPGHYSANITGKCCIANTNSPELAYTDPTLVLASWTTTPDFSGVTNFNYGSRYYVIFNVFMVPVLDREYENEFLNYYIIAQMGSAHLDALPPGALPVPLDSTVSYNGSGATLTAHLGSEYFTGCHVIDPVLVFQQFGAFFEIMEFSPEYGEPSGPGGYGGSGFDGKSENVLAPNLPSTGFSSTGFVHVYNPTTGDLQSLGSLLIPQLTFSAPTPVSTGLGIADAFINGFNSLATWLANVPDMIQNSQKMKMVDFVVDCHLIPFPLTSGNRDNIRVGWETLPITAPVVGMDYGLFDFGDLDIAEFYENFADYLTCARMYIPFVGYVSMQPEWFNNARLNLECHYNVIDGSFMMYLFGYPSPAIGSSVSRLRSRTMLGQWGGSACIHIPITGTNYASMMSGAIGGAAGAIQAAGTGNLAGAATSAIAAVSARGTVEQSNSYSASSGYLANRTAFIQIERPVSFFSKSYDHEIGIPSNISAKIGSASGFVRSDDVHLDGIPCTDAERQMIQRALQEGIIV